MWEEELGAMRTRIQAMRRLLADRLVAAGSRQDVSFITRQKGMFSYTGLSKTQMERLRNDFGVYGVDSGRICVAALNPSNIEAVVKAMGAVA
jgi:aromatic-amino-acid transaminase